MFSSSYKSLDEPMQLRPSCCFRRCYLFAISIFPLRLQQLQVPDVVLLVRCFQIQSMLLVFILSSQPLEMQDVPPLKYPTLFNSFSSLSSQNFILFTPLAAFCAEGISDFIICLRYSILKKLKGLA
jgi:hypothetical protein